MMAYQCNHSDCENEAEYRSELDGNLLCTFHAHQMNQEYVNRITDP